MEGFDFAITTEGELIVNTEDHDITKSMDDDLRIQLAYNRIKSVSNDWFVDEIGADMEELIGRPCTEEIAEYGKTKIKQVLEVDGLWDDSDIYIKGEISDNVHIIYTIYLRTTQSDTEETITYEIIMELDLVKGVFIRYGWEPRR